MTRLVWIKGRATAWLSFETLPNFSRISADGVYILWYGGPKPGIVRIGKGDISSRLNANRADPKILVYRSLGLYVTWAEVPFSLQDGVERYLADQLRPIVGDPHADVTPIPVNLPWTP
jgi:hypothetical protein